MLHFFEVLPAELTLPAVLARQAAAFADRPLVRCEGETWTYEETLEQASGFARELRAAGVETGDRVAVMAGNCPEILRVWLGGGWTGAITVPVNTASRGPQLEHILTDSGAKILVIEPALLPQVDLLDAPFPGLERLWTIGDGPVPESWRGLPVETIPRASTRLDPYPARPGDPLTIFYTGGTTGPSKGVCCPHAQSYWWGKIVSTELGLDPEDVLHTTLPLFHTNGLHTFWQALVSGATLSFGSRFSASGFLPALVEAEATVTYLLGAMVNILLGRSPSDADRAHGVRIALAPGAPAARIDEFESRFGIELVDAYGSTETNMITSTRVPGALRGTMGRLVDGFEALVADDDDQPLPLGEPGELLLRCREPFSFATGYWRNPEHTAEAYRNLWFHTGDRVVQDAQGCLTFVDRKKDAIRRRGENISSWEVEQALLSHADVAAAAVVPVSAELGEDEVMAFVVFTDGAAVDPSELIRHCEPLLAYFAIPRYVEIVDELPQTEVGRVRKFVLRERGVGPRTWDREADFEPPKA